MLRPEVAGIGGQMLDAYSFRPQTPKDLSHPPLLSTFGIRLISYFNLRFKSGQANYRAMCLALLTLTLRMSPDVA